MSTGTLCEISPTSSEAFLLISLHAHRRHLGLTVRTVGKESNTRRQKRHYNISMKNTLDVGTNAIDLMTILATYGYIASGPNILYAMHKMACFSMLESSFANYLQFKSA